MLNAMPSQISSQGREQPDIITRRHKVSGSGGLQNPIQKIQKKQDGN